MSEFVAYNPWLDKMAIISRDLHCPRISLSLEQHDSGGIPAIALGYVFKEEDLDRKYDPWLIIGELE
jgi:hypothetical protein